MDFLTGFFNQGADRVSKLGEDQESNAFKLKLQNAQIVQTMNAQMKMRQFENDLGMVSPETTAHMGKLAGGKEGNIFPPGARRSPQELGLLAGMERAELNAAGRQARAAQSGGTVADLERIYQVDTGITDKSKWLTATQWGAWGQRLKSETPTAEVANSYAAVLKGRELFKQLKELRKSAMEEVKQGIVAGRVSKTASVLDQGANLPKANTYLKFVEANLGNLSKLSGETGKLAEGDVERARSFAPGFIESNDAVDSLYSAFDQQANDSISTYEQLYPQLRRKKETNQGEGRLRSLDEAKKDKENKNPAAPKKSFAQWKAEKEAADRAKKAK